MSESTLELNWVAYVNDLYVTLNHVSAMPALPAARPYFSGKQSIDERMLVPKTQRRTTPIEGVGVGHKPHFLPQPTTHSQQPAPSPLCSATLHRKKHDAVSRDFWVLKLAGNSEIKNMIRTKWIIGIHNVATPCIRYPSSMLSSFLCLNRLPTKGLIESCPLSVPNE